VTDLLLRKTQAGRARSQGGDDYDVIDAGGLVIGRIFKATKSPSGTPLDVDAGLRGAQEPNADAWI
jgi:hypothetical protein